MARFLILALFTAFAGVILPAQSLIQTRVVANNPNAQFQVDGVTYTGAQTFLWVEGSVHILEVGTLVQSSDSLPGLSPGVRYTFQAWSAPGSTAILTGPRVVIQASRDITEYLVAFLTEIRLTIRMPNCAVLPDLAPESRPPQIPYITPTCYAPGVVFLAGTEILATLETWSSPNAVLQLQARAAPGYYFAGWTTTLGNGQSFATDFTPPPLTVPLPVTVIPRFELAHRVRFRTRLRQGCGLADPNACPDAGFRFTVDGGQIQTPVENDAANNLKWVIRDWLPGSAHLLVPTTPQRDSRGKMWVFDGFSTLTSTTPASELLVPITAGPASSQFEIAQEVTAWYAEAFTFFLSSNPQNVPLIVNGRSWPSYSFYASVGTKFDIEAPETFVGTDGRRYAFVSWSNGGARRQTVEFTQEMATSGRALTASYELLGRVSIRTNPTGLPVDVDGRACALPCVLDRPIGQTAVVSVRRMANNDASRRDEFLGWGDSDELSRRVTFTREGQEYTANYRTSYRIAAVADPPEAADLRFEPASPDAFYPAGQQVSVTATARNGWKLRFWRGDGSGTGPTETLFADRPLTLTAVFQAVEPEPVRGIRDAAGAGLSTSDIGTVAPGSLVTLFGGKFSLETAEGKPNPIIPQVLGSTTVRVAGRLLGLLFVSPQQVNALLPGGLPDGRYEAVVQSAGLDEVRIPFNVARNAPGLFHQRVRDRNLAVALRDRDALVTFEAPARPGELIRLLGTGLGPFRNPFIEGFPVPAEPLNELADRVEIVLGDRVLEPEAVYATPGQFGLATIELRIDDRLPRRATVELEVRINGRPSNKVLLPLD
jgi:uncharacterized protein (TIGR03437 family)